MATEAPAAIEAGHPEEEIVRDRLYIGGGNAGMVDISGLGGNVTIVSNLNGLLGGINLWRDASIPEAPKQSK